MVVVTSASAQLTEALPLAANANVAEAAGITVDGSFYTASDNSGFGARCQYKVNDSLAAYGAVVSPEEGLGFSVGAVYALPFDLPCSTAVRAGAGYWTWDDADATAIDLNATLIASGALDSVLDGLGRYGNAGFHFVKFEVGRFDDTETAIHLGGGVTFDVTDMVTAFGGVDIMSSDFGVYDETFIGGGVRVALGGDAM
jgi:hypothetical protein